MSEGELIKTVAVESIVAKRDEIVGKLRAAHALMAEVSSLQEDFLGESRSHHATRLESVFDRSKRFPDSEDLPYFVGKVDAAIWDRLLNDTGIYMLMDATARDEWHRALEKDVPEVTPDNIRATFSRLYDDRKGMFERGVVKVFQGLSWDYKTNNPRMLGKRIITRSMLHGYKGFPAYADHQGASKVDDLLRVMHILDGKPEPDRNGCAMQLFHKADWPRSEVVELHGMLKLRGFKNGNAHITFLRPELVDGMNKIIAKHYSRALPPSAEEA